jgi:hypothetical protein
MDGASGKRIAIAPVVVNAGCGAVFEVSTDLRARCPNVFKGLSRWLINCLEVLSKG